MIGHLMTTQPPLEHLVITGTVTGSIQMTL